MKRNQSYQRFSRKLPIQAFYSAKLVVFYESVLEVFRGDTNLYLKLIKACNFLVSKRREMFSFCGRSLQYFMMPYGAQLMKRWAFKLRLANS